MLDGLTAEVCIDRPGMHTIRIGPMRPHEAHTYALRLQEYAQHTEHVPGSLIVNRQYDRSLPHLPPVPTEPVALAVALDQQTIAGPAGAGFPDVRVRLACQVGAREALNLLAAAEQHSRPATEGAA